MTPSDWFTLIGIVMTALSAAATVYGVLNGRISKAVRTLHEKIDEVKRDYVRRDDLRDDIHNFKEDINRIERGQENIAAKVDGFSAALLPAIADLAKVAIALRNK
jgi:hypothetical protein